jgi:hypothetical protein
VPRRDDRDVELFEGTARGRPTERMDANGARHLLARLTFQAGVGDRIELLGPLDDVASGEWGTVEGISSASGLEVAWDCGVRSVLESTQIRFRVHRD